MSQTMNTGPEAQDIVTRSMTIEEVFTRWPGKSQRLAQEITNTGLHCVGCSAATYETLEAGMFGHGFSDEQIDALVERLNAILGESQDLSSITLTPRAAKKYLAILAEEGKQGWGIRLDEKAAGCSGFEFVLDYSEAPDARDTVLESHGLEIHLRSEIVERMLGTEIDYIDGLNGSGFKVSNPNVKASCGCGTSHNY